MGPMDKSRVGQIEGIVFKRQGEAIKYLALKRNVAKGGFWQPLTGGIHSGEDTRAALIRELGEELGLIEGQYKIIDLHYSFEFTHSSGKTLSEQVFGIEVKADQAIKLSDEHTDSRWLSFAAARRLFKWDTNKEALSKLDSLVRVDVTITYQPHSADLVDLRVKWLNDPTVNQYLGSDPTNQAKQKTWFEKYEKDESKHFFTIMANNQPIGVVGLMKIDLKRKTAEAFVMIGEAEYRGRGLGVAAIKYIKHYASGIGLTSLYLGVYQKNQAAILAYQSAGFTFEPANDNGEWLGMVWHSK